MSVLSYQSIKRLCQDPHLRKPLVNPCRERTVEKGMSYGLSGCGYDCRALVDGERHLLASGSFVLISTIEQFAFPRNIVGLVKDKSSWARRGVVLQNTVLEPGWIGHITLEVSNHGEEEVVLATGMPIAQIIFQWLDKPTEMPYVGKYQDQPAKPVKAVYELLPPQTLPPSAAQAS